MSRQLSVKVTIKVIRVTTPRVYTRTHKKNHVTNVKHLIVHVRVRSIMDTRKDPACTLISLRLSSTTLLQLAFLGEKRHEFPMGEIPIGTRKCLKKSLFVCCY